MQSRFPRPIFGFPEERGRGSVTLLAGSATELVWGGVASACHDAVEELRERRVVAHAVLEAEDAVPLVVEAKVLDGAALLLQPVHDLLRLVHRHARVVRAVHDEERRLDAIDLADRAQAIEQLAVARERSVLRLS